jgi:hypothetical protein
LILRRSEVSSNWKSTAYTSLLVCPQALSLPAGQPRRLLAFMGQVGRALFVGSDEDAVM